MRRCFIHIGTHKTGTTSLQHTLSTHSHELEGFGYCYPRSGRPQMAPHGHHNIAWEISNDERFSQEVGSIDDLLTELADLPYDVILSSEDFECSAHHSEQFSLFVERLKRCRFDVKFIVYFRNQIEYAESLYLTMLLFELNTPYRKYIDEILESGKFCWRSWIFPFDYDEFLTRLRSIDGVELVVRSYDALEKGALVSNFLSILGLHSNGPDIIERIWLNERCSTTETVAAFYRNCVRRPLLASEQVALASLFRSAGSRVEMNDQSKLDLIEKFDDSNRRLFIAYGIPEFEYMRPKRIRTESSKGMSMEDIFSSGLRDAVEEMIGSTNARNSTSNEPR
jgi:hypothetical protein